MSPQDRIQVIDTPVAAPGTCAICGVDGSVKDRQFVDFGFQLDFFGAVIFCTECMLPLAQAMDYIPVAERDHTLKLAEGYLVEIEKVKKENEVLKNALVVLLSNSGFAIRYPNGDVLPSEDLYELATDHSGSPETKSEPNKSSGSKESGSVLSDSGDSESDDDAGSDFTL